MAHTHKWEKLDELSDEEASPSSSSPPSSSRRYIRGRRPMAVLIAAVTPPDGDKKKQPLSFGSMLKKNQLERLEIKKEITQSDIISVTRCAGDTKNDIEEAHAKLKILKTKLAHLSPSDEIEACNRAIAEKENLITELNAKQSNRHRTIKNLNDNLEKINKIIEELSHELSDELSKEKSKKNGGRRAKTHAKYRAKHRSKKSNKTRTRR